MTQISRAIAQFDYPVRLKLDPKCHKDQEGRKKWYVIAYRNKQEVLPDGRRRSRIAESFHIGPLMDDGSVKLGAAFLKRYPNFEGGQVYYFENRLVTKSQYAKLLAKKRDEVTDDDDTMATPPDSEEALDTLEAGPALLFDQIAKENLLHQTLRQVWKKDASKLYSLLIYTALRMGAFEHYNTARNTTYIPNGQDLSSQRISELLATVTDAKTHEFWKAVMQLFLKKNTLIACACDSTSISTYSELIEFAEWGYNKQGESLPQVNLTTMVDCKSGRVVFARESPGSIPDVSSFIECYKEILDANLPRDSFYFIMDRGYECLANLIALLMNNQHFVMAASVAKNSHLRAQFVDLYDKLFLTRNQFNFGTENIYGIKGKPIHITEDEPETGKKLSFTLVPRLYLNINKHAQMCDELDNSLVKALELRNAGQEVPMEIWSVARHYLRQDETGWYVDDELVSTHRKYFGTFAIWTTFENDSPKETLEKYRQRNEIEAQFRWLKQETDGKRMYSTEKSYRATLFFNVLAASLRQQLSKKIAQSEVCRELKIHTVPQLLMTITGVQMKFRGKQWVVKQPTAKRRRLLTEFGILAK